MTNRPPGDIYARRDEHLAELSRQYPAQFREEMISCDWPDGWHALVRECCATVSARFAETRWLQIKEKYGGLRLYYLGGPMRVDMRTAEGLYTFGVKVENSGGNPALDELIQRIEKAALHTCCRCGGSQGAPGKPTDFGGWWLPACDSCAPLIRAHREARGLDGDLSCPAGDSR